MRKSARVYAHNGFDGCVTQFVSRATGTVMGVYHGAQAGMECDEALPWSIVCERHNTLVSVETLSIAHKIRDPREFCDDCREMPEGSIAYCTGCKVHYTRKNWKKLTLMGIQGGNGLSLNLELRRCACETCLAIPTLKKPK